MTGVQTCALPICCWSNVVPETPFQRSSGVPMVNSEENAVSSVERHPVPNYDSHYDFAEAESAASTAVFFCPGSEPAEPQGHPMDLGFFPARDCGRDVPETGKDTSPKATCFSRMNNQNHHQNHHHESRLSESISSALETFCRGNSSPMIQDSFPHDSFSDSCHGENPHFPG